MVSASASANLAMQVQATAAHSVTLHRDADRLVTCAVCATGFHLSLWSLQAAASNSK